MTGYWRCLQNYLDVLLDWPIFWAAKAINVSSADDPTAENSEEFLELANGCLCCSIKDSGIAAIEKLMQRKGAFDHILLETTGLADPGAWLLPERPRNPCWMIDETKDPLLPCSGTMKNFLWGLGRISVLMGLSASLTVSLERRCLVFYPGILRWKLTVCLANGRW